MRDSIISALRSGPRQNAANAAVFEFRFDAEEPLFAGHFPGRPILPGAFSLEMTRLAAELTLSCRLCVLEIRRAKFQRPILPGEVVWMELKLSRKDDTIEASADLSVDGKTAAQVKLSLWRNE